ncbi:MAG: tripartite tricarboxylate transporter permease [Spirochaetales bacterium]|nr:tripartite tricarboxylate transporter permease [Spirochaetales bacterium]
MQNLLMGLQQLFTLKTMLFVVIGAVVGLLAGAIPGLNDTNILTLFLSFILFIDPFPAVILMTAVFISCQTAGSIPAILVNIPGTPSTAASTLEGYALTKQGKAGQALGCSFASSLMGTVLGGIMALLLAPIIGKYALSFGPPEMFMLAIFGMTAVASLTGNSVSKGLLAAVLGLLVGTIGLDYFIGVTRSTFGVAELYSGIPQIPLLLGLFGVGELYSLIKKKSIGTGVKTDAPDVKSQFEGFKAAFRYKKSMFLSAVIGFVVGVIPGTGATIASFTSYGTARSISKEPEKFGKGHYEGLVATDTSNNASVPGSIVPALTLGIPGSGTTVLFISAFLMHGMQPGPSFFSEHITDANAIFLTVIFVGIIATFVGMVMAKQMVKVVSLPTHILAMLIAMFCLMGAYICRNKVNDLFIMLAFSILAIFLKKYDYPLPAFLLGVILGPIIEPNFFRALAISDNNFSIFFTRPICIVLWIMCLAALAMPKIIAMKAKKKKEGENAV